MKHTSKKFQLVKAKKAFQQDLQSDPDFVAFKEKAVNKDFSFGVLIAGNTKFLLEALTTSQSLIYKQAF
jgi:hypothetical protein